MDPKAVVERWVEHFNDGDIAGIVGLYADDATLHVNGAEHVGKHEIKSVFDAYFNTGKLHCRVETLHLAGEWVILEWTHANGLPGVNLHRVVDGRIVTQRNYFDQLTFFRKMGIPLPPA